MPCAWRGGPGVGRKCASRDSRQGTTLQSCNEEKQLLCCPISHPPKANVSTSLHCTYVWRAGDKLQGGLPVMQVLDGRADTKWLDFGGGAAGQATWLEVRRQCVVPPLQQPPYAAELVTP